MKEEDKISLAEHLLEVATMEPLVIAKSHDNHLSKLVKVPMPRLLSKGKQKQNAVLNAGKEILLPVCDSERRIQW